MTAIATPYEMALGPEAFAKLPAAVREMHRHGGPTSWRGRAHVTCGDGLLTAAARRIAGLPAQTGEMPLSFEIERIEKGDGTLVEMWTRRFGESAFRSMIGYADGKLYDQFGPARFSMGAFLKNGILNLPISGASTFGIALPRALWPEPHAFEREDRYGRFRFDVRISFPGIGLVAAYEGWLEPVSGG